MLKNITINETEQTIRQLTIQVKHFHQRKTAKNVTNFSVVAGVTKRLINKEQNVPNKLNVGKNSRVQIKIIHPSEISHIPERYTLIYNTFIIKNEKIKRYGIQPNSGKTAELR